MTATSAITEAVAWTARAAGLPWPLEALGPTPLDRCINALRLTHDEVTPLTRRHASDYLRRCGVLRAELASDETPLAGFLFATPSAGAILVRSDDTLPRRRFSAAHELGHYVLHFLPLLRTSAQAILATDDERIDEQPPDLPAEPEESPGAAADERARREQEANRFAAELLMPEVVCQRLCQAYQVRFGAAAHASARFLEHHLATDLLVSREAIRVRLQTLRLVPLPS